MDITEMLIVFILILIITVLFNLFYLISLINTMEKNENIRKKHEKYISHLPPIESIDDHSVMFSDVGRGVRFKTKKGTIHLTKIDDGRVTIELYNDFMRRMIWLED